MRTAVLVTLWDPRSSDAVCWTDAVAWLPDALGRLGFRVSVVDGTQDLETDLAYALDGVSARDSVFMHVSGRLPRRAVFRFGGGDRMPLRMLGEALSACPASPRVALVAELLHEDDPGDARVTEDHVDSALKALGVRKRDWTALAAVRSASAPIDGLAFTKLLLDLAASASREEGLLTRVHERVLAMPEVLAAGQRFAFVAGSSDLDLAPPIDVGALDVLIDDATQSEQWALAVELRRQRLASIESPQMRARELVRIARILQRELGDASGAVGALEEAREADPTRIGPLQALRRGYQSLGLWENAVDVIGAIAELTESPPERAALRFEQATIALTRIQDEGRAVAWLESALEDDPSHAEARAKLDELRPPPPPEPDLDEQQGKALRMVAKGEDAPALELLEWVVARAPERQSMYAAIFDVHRRQGRTDAAFLAALALEELSAADVDQEVLIDQYRSMAAVRARATLDAAAWHSLRAPGSDDVLESLFAAIGPAAVTSQLKQRNVKRRLTSLDPAARLSESSTASIVRSFQWASRVLGVTCPDLYMLDHVPGEIAAVPEFKPSTAVGPTVVRGRSVKELAFLVGRHLTYYRPEHHVLVHFSSRDALAGLVLAAAQLAMPDEMGSVGGPAVAALRARLRRHLTEADLAAVRDAVRRLHARGGRASLGSWTRSVELTAGRAGLLLCGDLATAMSILRSESRAIAGVSVDAKRADLLCFCPSRAHADLRARFATTAPESLHPMAQRTTNMAVDYR